MSKGTSTMDDAKPSQPNDSSAGSPPNGRPPLAKQKPLRRWPLVVIALDKLFKAVGLVVVSFVLRSLLAPAEHQAVEEWINHQRLEPHDKFIHYVFDLSEKGMGIPPHTLQNLRLGVIIYAGLYLIEGVGLLGDWKWAEWLVVVTTAMFLPLEMYEIWRDVTWGRCLLFLANILILVYLCYRLRRRSQGATLRNG
jgi:uncharacterized membrane protein (DUF2068 family)